MNWIGGHAVFTARYYQVSYFSRHDEAPAFNVVFRVLAPVVYLVLVSTALYSLGLAYFVQNIYLVAAYHAIGRWAFNLIAGRRLLLRWRTQFIVAAATIGLAYLAYRQILSNPSRLLPDFSTLSNELWIVVILFLYKLFDRVDVPHEANQARTVRYLRRRYEELTARFGTIIRQELQERAKSEPLVYSVLIYETFNRPTFIQWLERRVLFRLKIARSLGPMQVQSERAISDDDSVRLGVQKLTGYYQACAAPPA